MVLEGVNGILFLDFDGTMCVHHYIRKDMAMSYQRQCEIELDRALRKEEHGGDVPLACMQWLVKECKEAGVWPVVLTQEIFNLRDADKKQFAGTHYGIRSQDYFTVDKPEHKPDMMKAVADLWHIPYENCFLVEDSVANARAAEQAGFNGLTLGQVVYAYEKKLLPEEFGVFFPEDRLLSFDRTI